MRGRFDRECQVGSALRLGLVVLAAGSMCRCDAKRGEGHAEGVIEVTPRLDLLYRWPGPFSGINGFVHLDGQALAISDSRERRITILDISTGEADSLERLGQGPGEFRVPGRLFLFSQATFLAEDHINGRVLRLSQSGDPLGVLNLPLVLAGSRLMGSDTIGKLYFEGRPTRFEAAGTTTASDSAPVLSWWPERDEVDTVLRVLYPASVTAQRFENGPNRTSISTFEFLQPFSQEDTWLTRADGRLVVARVDPPHIEVWRGATLMADGPRIPWKAEPVTAADKERYLRAPMEVNYEFPDTKPAFTEGALVPSGDSFVWLEMTGGGDSRGRHYLILDSGGIVIGRTWVLDRRRILWTRRDTAFVAKVDENDLTWLEIHILRWPP